jgi:hypothetical protein
MVKCPGQDSRYWTEDAVFDVVCPACEAPVEVFRTDTVRRCPSCGYRFKNPRLDLGCAEWCAYADRCLTDLRRVSTDCVLSDQQTLPLINSEPSVGTSDLVTGETS